MNHDEVKQLFGAIKALYPNFNPDNIKIAVDTWAAVLADMDAKVINAALCIYARTDTSGFAPSIGALMNTARDATTNDVGALEAWAQVSRAIRNSTYNAQTEFDKLPPAAQKAIGAPSQLRTWAIDENYNESVVQSHFIRAYNTVVEREKNDAMIPQAIRIALEGANNDIRRKQIKG